MTLKEEDILCLDSTYGTTDEHIAILKSPIKKTLVYLFYYFYLRAHIQRMHLVLNHLSSM